MGNSPAVAASAHPDPWQAAAKIDSLEEEEDDGLNAAGMEAASMEKVKLVKAEFQNEEEEEEEAEKAMEAAERREDSTLFARCADLALMPIRWMGMLGREVDESFVFGIMVTYGWSQGFGNALYKIAGNYYWKDVQRIQPATAQIYNGIISSVWDWKPIWGLFTDLLPLAGFHRRPYFILSGLFSFLSLLVLMANAKVQGNIAVIIFLIYTLGVTIADVTIDAEVAKRSRNRPTLAPDIQTLCSISQAVCGFIGFSTSGFLVHMLGPKNALGLLSVSGALFLILGFTLNEPQVSKHSFQYKEVGKKLGRTCNYLWKTMCYPHVWKPTLYMYISWATSPNVAEGKFFWYTDQDRGLGFTEEFVGMSFAVGSIGAFFGTIAYQNVLKNCSFRKILFWAQVLVFIGGGIDLVLVLRWNVKLHIPDSLFFLFDEITIQSVSRLKWIPQLVLCAKLCPAGIEGTFFALLMAVDNLGLLTSTWSGALLQHGLGITRDNYSNLWLAVLIRNLLRLLPLGVLFLVPNTDPSSQVIPPELMVIDENDEVLELVEKGSS